MNKLVFVPILIIISITISGCDNLSIKRVAFNSLTEEEKDLIPVSPKDSIVKIVTVNDDIKSSIDKDYEKNNVYSVKFNNTETDSSGHLIVFVDLDKETVVGKKFTSK